MKDTESEWGLNPCDQEELNNVKYCVTLPPGVGFISYEESLRHIASKLI